ncbi:unnamed protein product [Rotaria sp. Silwood2]|nr:unnamed protein product [Rotaria sp. Silwood2]CAF2811848.1 unnamed protein product [Rotaria sp. Silwood2]CAF2977841.1 unnamed protein product [Rotaria sp. Silwood2]CAF3868472.1 unnamed protein product [Rotaria sp. Silwood2]CAF3894185.1 unnamed protein product [Rotaria sp. Silwood2]
MSSCKKRTISEETKDILTIDLTDRNTDLESFSHPFYRGGYGAGHQPKTLVELKMIRLSGSIRSKSKWYEKMKDEIIRNKWKQEAVEQSNLTEKQIDYVLAELEYYDLRRDGSMEMSTVDGVWQSDELIPIDMKESLIACVKNLENIPESEQDWHPGTNKQILDLVHPSLFCFVNQITRIINDKNRIINVDNALEHIGDGQIIDINEEESSLTNKRRKTFIDYTESTTYQWLPAEFNISKDGQVTIESYINNLHPIEHKQLYQSIEQICEHFIPMFNKVLTDLVYNNNKRNRIFVDSYSRSSDSHTTDDDDDDDLGETPRLYIREFQMPSSKSSSIDLRGRKLQIIVKLANIILTPDNSKYPGGVWHVEGMENEHIVATGIFYYFSSNITQSELQFRTVICEPDHQQNDNYRVSRAYGLYDQKPLNQALGEVITQENRCIVFPNIYQHRVAPFQLKDSTQSGQRKILVFFLVDPTIRILSTANVPPQQSHWFVNILRSMPPFNQLPLVVVDKILNYTNFPMSMNDAKEHRKKLMDERKYFISEHNELLFERPFSLCEH